MHGLWCLQSNVQFIVSCNSYAVLDSAAFVTRDIILPDRIHIFCFVIWQSECYVEAFKHQFYSELLFILSKLVCIPLPVYTAYTHVYVYVWHTLTCIYVICFSLLSFITLFCCHCKMHSYICTWRCKKMNPLFFNFWCLDIFMKNNM